MPSCSRCRNPIPMLARGDARFCSTRCRVAAHRNQPPAELRAIDRWVRFSETKVPLRLDGRNASSTNPSTWSTHADAEASDVGVGVGFVLNGDGIVCVDLDHCVAGNRLAPWAAAILADCPPTFTERSVSGTGLHVWGYADVRRGRKLTVGDGGLEVYGTSRYIAVTGRRWSTMPATLADLTDWVASLLETYA